MFTFTFLAFLETRFSFQYGAASRCLAPKKIEVRERDVSGCPFPGWFRTMRALIYTFKPGVLWELQFRYVTSFSARNQFCFSNVLIRVR